MSQEQAYRTLVQVMTEALFAVARHVDNLSRIQGEANVDTKKLLDAVAREKTENDSLRALVGANTKALQDASQQVSDMSGQIDPLRQQVVGLQGSDAGSLKQQVSDLTRKVSDLLDAATQAQNDIDQAVNDLSVDSDASHQAVVANVSNASQVNQSGAGSAGASSSSSSSGASDGGGVSGQSKPDPLPGTGVAQQQGGQDQSSGAQGGQTGQASQASPTDTAALSGGIADPAKPGSQPPPEDADAAGQTRLSSDPAASRGPQSGA